MNMNFKRKLTIPMETKAMYPLSRDMEAVIELRRQEIKDIFTGKDQRILLVIGPCSADHEDSVIDYISRLIPVQEKISDRILIVPRVYTGKPRTTGEGYKGMLHQPDPEAEPDLYKGIIAMRELHMRALNETGFVCADEMLYPENYKYVDDLLGYVAVGARSVEDQQHRMTASGIEIPVGMKNPTSGDMSVMLNSIHAAQQPQDFIYRGWEAHSYGNPLAHAVLRGYTDRYGVMHPNYYRDDILELIRLYRDSKLENPALIVDCNHANSGKDPFRQIEIVKDVLGYRWEDSDIRSILKGFMVESYIEDGRQDVSGKVYGQSITDACIGWKKTESLIYDMAEMIQ